MEESDSSQEGKDKDLMRALEGSGESWRMLSELQGVCGQRRDARTSEANVEEQRCGTDTGTRD